MENILNEYEESIIEISTPKNRKEDRFKTHSRTDKFITTIE